jgi:hypothetical protein
MSDVCDYRGKKFINLYKAIISDLLSLQMATPCRLTSASLSAVFSGVLAVQRGEDPLCSAERSGGQGQGVGLREETHLLRIFVSFLFFCDFSFSFASQ